jgi:hypothetical protein
MVQELEQYAIQILTFWCKIDPFQNEVGIFYVRYPNEKKEK